MSRNVAVSAPDDEDPFFGVWVRDGFDSGRCVAQCETSADADLICTVLARHYGCRAYPIGDARPPMAQGLAS